MRRGLPCHLREVTGWPLAASHVQGTVLGQFGTGSCWARFSDCVQSGLLYGSHGSWYHQSR